MVVKNIVPEATFHKMEKVGERWAIRVKLSEPDESGLIMIGEKLIGHEPTESDYESIHAELTKKAKVVKIASIDEFDSSPAVNGFIYNGGEFWLDKATRVGLVNSTNMLKQIGEETTTLWLDSFCVTLPCDMALQMLCAIEVYALKCYNRTAEHKANVNALTTLAEVEAYDYTTGYPEKLVFNA